MKVVKETEKNSSLLVSQHDRMNSLRKDATILDVAKTLATIRCIGIKLKLSDEDDGVKEPIDRMHTENTNEQSRNTSHKNLLEKQRSTSPVCNDHFPLKVCMYSLYCASFRISSILINNDCLVDYVAYGSPFQ